MRKRKLSEVHYADSVGAFFLLYWSKTNWDYIAARKGRVLLGCLKRGNKVPFCVFNPTQTVKVRYAKEKSNSS